MPGKPNRPLFELLRDPQRNSNARERGEAGAAGTVEAKPDPTAVIRPATPSRIEVMKPALAAARDADAPRNPEPFVRVKKSAISLAIAGVFLVALFLWVIAYSRGKAVGSADTERKLGVLTQPVQPNADPLSVTTGGTQSDSPTPGNAGEGASSETQKQAPPQKQTPATKPARKSGATAPTTTAMQVVSGTGDILTPAGRTTQDPRVPDSNYLVLTIIAEEDAAEVIAFLSRNGLESFAVPNKGDRRAASGRKTVVLIASGGISAEQYKKKDPIRTQTEQAAAKLGAAWKKQGGAIDFAQMYWQKFDR